MNKYDDGIQVLITSGCSDNHLPNKLAGTIAIIEKYDTSYDPDGAYLLDIGWYAYEHCLIPTEQLTKLEKIIYGV